MLILKRKPGTAILIGDGIRVSVQRCKSGEVILGIEAPPEMPIYRDDYKGPKEEQPCQSPK